MTQDKNTAGHRIESIAKAKGLPVGQELAAMLGVSYETLRKWRAGATAPNRNRAADIAKLLEVPEAEFMHSTSGEMPSLAAMPPPPSGPPMRASRAVPVIGRTQGGLPERIWDDGGHPVGASDEYAEAATPDPHAFACRVVGDSMIPKYMPGSYALVEPSVAPEIEDDVLVRLATGETMLKRLVGRRGGIRLGSYNSPEVLSYREDEVAWLYYVPHPIPARKIRQRIDMDVRRPWQSTQTDSWVPSGDFLGGDSQIGGLQDVPPSKQRGVK